MDMRDKLRWIATPFAALAAMVGTAIVLVLLGDVIARLVPWHTLNAVVPPHVRAGLLGALVAAATIIAGCRTAPSHRTLVAIVVYVAGAWLALKELRHWYFPEGTPMAYRESLVPLVMTLLGGFATLAIQFAYTRKAR